MKGCGGMVFIYAFSNESRDKLLASGLQMIKADSKRSRYVFLHDGHMDFAQLDLDCAISNTLTF